MVKDPQTETHVGECHSSHQPTPVWRWGRERKTGDKWPTWLISTKTKILEDNYWIYSLFVFATFRKLAKKKKNVYKVEEACGAWEIHFFYLSDFFSFTQNFFS